VTFFIFVFVEKILVKWKLLLQLAAVNVKAKCHATIYMVASTQVGYCSSFLSKTPLWLGIFLPRVRQVQFNMYGDSGIFLVN